MNIGTHKLETMIKTQYGDQLISAQATYGRSKEGVELLDIWINPAMQPPLDDLFVPVVHGYLREEFLKVLHCKPMATDKRDWKEIVYG